MYSKEEFEKWYDEKYCLEMVRENGLTLRYIKNQTEKICLEAIRQNWYALQYVKNQTEEICLEAVRQNPETLRYVDIRKFPRVWKYYVLENS